MTQTFSRILNLRLVGLEVLAFCFIACSAPVHISSGQIESRDNSRQNFIQTKDSIFHNVRSVKQNGIYNSTFTLDDGTKLTSEKVLAFQTDRGYYGNVGRYFVVRIKTGSINKYMHTESSMSRQDVHGNKTLAYQSGGFRTNDVVEYQSSYYIQKNSGQILMLTPDRLAEYVRNNVIASAIADECVKYYQKNKNKVFPKNFDIAKRMDEAMDEYNKNPS